MKSLLFVCVLVWLLVAISGGVYLTRYENTPGDPNVGYPSTFPAASQLKRDGSLPTLIFFAHPKCPCTRASLHELARLMTDIDGKVRAYVVFIKPKDETDEWVMTDLRDIAESIPNLQIVTDQDERETEIFNAQTSSLTLLYDRAGNLRFDGGITASRGHEGDNAGRSSLYQIVMEDANQNAETPVYGCPLHKKDCPGELMTAPRQSTSIVNR